MAGNIPAKKSDFPHTKVMSDKNKTVEINVGYSDEQMKKIKFGMVPRDMDDRWFIYYAEDEETLYIHRSWSGLCVYMVKFKKVDSGSAAVNAVVNEDPEEYRFGDNAEEKSKCLDLIDTLLLGERY
jgi:hypothetical protein